MQCQSCGAENDSARLFCGDCGKSLVLSCSHCAFENVSGAKFCGGCGRKLDNTSDPSAIEEVGDERTEGRAAQAERRQVTVMFCDLVGSTELSTQIDPEELSDLYRTYRHLCEQVVSEHNGYVAEFLGDGIVAYFGYPQAQERAAEKAVYAALALASAISEAALQASGVAEVGSIRIGIATGLVVAGDLLGTSDSAQIRSVIGETPNLAARLQGIAEPGAVVISESTRRLLGTAFELQQLDTVTLRGIQTPVTPYRVVGAAAPAGESISMYGGGLIVGRSEEIAIFDDLWQSVAECSGQTLLISGEPGIGKTRLCVAILQQLEGYEHLTLELKASTLYQNTAFYPIAQLLRNQFDFSDAAEDDNEAALARLENAITSAGWQSSESMSLLCGLLDVTYRGKDGTSDLTADARRQRTLNVLVDWIVRLADQRPVMLIAEDLHWMDPSTLEMLGLLVEQAPTASVMIVSTFRPEHQTEWLTSANVTNLNLQPLRAADIATLIAGVSAGVDLPENVVDQVIRNSDGVPLFAEELTSAILESARIPLSGESQAMQGPAIPATLQDSLMVRLDRLGPAKELAQRAAVIGREFDYSLLNSLCAESAGALEVGLNQLVDARLIYQRGIPPRSSYSFKHALVRDAAYESMLRKRRQTLHSELAEVLQVQFPARVDREPELLAQHLEQAGEHESAIGYFQKAGEAAKLRSAHVEAVNHIRQGLSILGELTAGDTRDQLELALQIGMVAPLIATTGYANPSVEGACQRVRELARLTGDGPEIILAVYWLANFYMNSSNLPACRRAAEELLALAEQPGNDLHLPAAYLMMGFVNFFDGRHEECLDYLERNMQIFDIERDGKLYTLYGQDPGASAYGPAAVSSWILGRIDLAVAYAERGIALAKQVGDPFTQAMTEAFCAYTYFYRRERNKVEVLTNQSLALSEEQNFPQWLHQAEVIQGWAIATGTDRKEEGLNRVTRALEELAKTNLVVGAPFFMTALTETLMAAGAIDAAIDTVDQALGISDALENTWMDPHLLCLKVELLILRDANDRVGAREFLDRSFASAREMHSLTYELRTLCLAHRLGLATEAELARLPVVLDAIEGGETTTEIREAEELVKSLAAG